MALTIKNVKKQPRLHISSSDICYIIIFFQSLMINNNAHIKESIE